MRIVSMSQIIRAAPLASFRRADAALTYSNSLPASRGGASRPQ